MHGRGFMQIQIEEMKFFIISLTPYPNKNNL